jgi:hypothetical protein
MAKTTLTNTNNCYRNVLVTTGLDGNAQDNGGDLAYLVLAKAADDLDAQIAASLATGPDGLATGDDYTVADTYVNQYQEVIHRLHKYLGFGLNRIIHLFNDFDPSVGEPV